MKLKLFRVLVFSLFFCLLLTGCWDRKEINDIAFVLATGIDKESNLYRVTLQIALPGQMGAIGSAGGSGGTGGGKSWLLDSATGNSIRDANQRQQESLSRLLYFSHRRIIVIGENMARAGIEPIIEVISSVPQNRVSSYVLATRGAAKNALNNQTKMEKFPAEKIRKVADIWMNNPPTIKDVANVLQTEGIDLTLPLLAEVKKNQLTPEDVKEYINIDGLAVFKRDKLVGSLEGNQARGILLATNKAETPIVTFRVPQTNGRVSILCRNYKVDLQPTIQNNKINLTINFKADVYVLANESNAALGTGDIIQKIEQAAASEVEKEIQDGVRTLQQKYHSDALGIGDTLYRHNPKVWNRYKDNWDTLYPKIPVKVNALIHIEQTGSLTTPLGPRQGDLSK
ncbi:MAG: hypothetical protein JWN30_437 [Bacilli bacterium]|nr:hypothetical protein [Bacilli bacterium]